MTANLTSLRRHLPIFRALWTRVGIRAGLQGISRLEVLRTILSEGLDTWDRLDAGKRRPRKTSMRKPFVKYAVPAETAAAGLTETV